MRTLILKPVVWSALLLLISPVVSMAGGETDPSRITSISTPSMVEGDSGETQMEFVVTCDPCDTAVFATVDWELVDGTATVADNDYVGATGSFQVNGGSGPEEHQIFVGIVGDTKFEPDETFTLHLTGASVGDPSFFIDVSEGEGTILNDDPEIVSGTFTISKDFSDNNPASIDIGISCNDAVVADMSGGVSGAMEGSPAIFTLEWEVEASPTCTATESNVPVGYTSNNDGCVDVALVADGNASCTITNTQDPVTVTIDKLYSEAHPAGADPEVDITLYCGNAMVNGMAGSATITTFMGRANFTITEFPWNGTNCYATEAVPAGYVQDTSDASCGTDFFDAGFSVIPGGTDDPIEIPVGPAPDATCTITNRPTEAVFHIEKDFSDNNPMAVDVTGTCTDDGSGPGIVTNGVASTTASGLSSISTDFEVTVKYFDGTATCDGAETNDLPGYTIEAGDGPSPDCGVGQQLQDGGEEGCELFNDQDPIEIHAAKVYSNGGGNAVDFAVECTNLDTGGSVAPPTVSASPGNPAVFVVNDVMYDGTTLCSVSEPVPPGGYYESANTCTTANLDMTPNSDAPRTCEITNTPTRATFGVTKIFDDGNDVDEVLVTIDCNTGLILDQDKLLSHKESVEFVVTSYTEGTLECTITEDGESGYSGEYDNVSRGNIISSVSCEYPSEVNIGGPEHECVITNTPDPVEIQVFKDWVFSGNSQPDIDTFIAIEIGCESEFVGEPVCAIIGPASGGPYEVESGANGYAYHQICLGPTHLNDVTMVVQVIPNFPSTQCTVTEYFIDQSIEMENDCGTFNVSVNNGKTCTITNTVFFEGIPTLSQYGMMLMALLMLGVGFISFRRFS